MSSTLASPNTTRVLIVDDEQSIRTCFAAFLNEAGYETLTADNAEQALNFLAENDFDVVVSDIILPGLSGVDLLKAIKAIAPSVQVIMMTGVPTINSASEAVRVGASDYLTKPVDKAAILNAVHRADKTKRLLDENRHLAAENQRYQERLEEMVRDRTESLRQALDQIKRAHAEAIKHERLNALGQMVSGIAHDFNNVLMPILGYPEHFLSNPALLDRKADVVAALKDILSAANDAREIVRRLREFYRPSDALEVRPVILHDLARRVVALTEPAWKTQALASGRQIRVEIRQESPTVRVLASESGLREVFTNLVVNAVDALSTDGDILIRIGQDQDKAVIHVSDTGIGMSEEALKHCFEPFFTTKGEKGTGLGLAVCYGIIQRHGGRIDVQSQPGRGTVFTITLPYTPPDSVLASRPLSQTLSEPDGLLRVLVIDDDGMTRGLLRRYLSTDGHFVETSESGQRGLQMIATNDYDLVITDRAMPDVSGDSVALAVKRSAPDTAVLMLTGVGELMICRHETPEGVDGVVGKPVTSSELRHAIARVIAAGKERQIANRHGTLDT